MLLLIQGRGNCFNIIVEMSKAALYIYIYIYTYGEVYLIQHYVIKFVSDLRHGGGFL
jgi:hypothetical protein